MRVLKFPAGILLPGLFLLTVIISCRGTKKLKSPPNYNFAVVDEEEKLEPVATLKEISGIVWDPRANVFYAINDESGKIYFLDKESKALTGEYGFGVKADYEDVAVYKGVPYILRSDGMITRFKMDSSSKSSGVEAGKISLSGTNDFETLYTDPEKNAMVLICKNCTTDDEKTVSAYAFYPDSLGFDNKPLYRIDAEKIKKLSPVKSAKFQPSAAAIHPIMKKLYIISSASHQLVIADLSGNVESVYRLSPKLFPQPEGITFKQNGDMYISNEGLGGRATLLKFKFKYTDTTSSVDVPGVPYNFAKPDEKMVLGKHLHEISGMAYMPKRNMMLAENDEKGDIFTIDFKNKIDQVDKVKFGGKSDYEDIVYTDTSVYMLVSTGSVVEVKIKDSSFTTTEFELGGEKNEFEAMYLEKATNSLILLCKECVHEKDEVRVAWRFNLLTKTFSADPAYTIHIADIQKMLGDEKAEFKPSAAGINPITGKLFIVASVGKLLVIASKDGKIEHVFRLDPLVYNQPEGMTFASNGDLYISNEGGEGDATILKFNYKK